MADIGTIIDDKYELIKCINKGGMSAVYLAINKRLGNRWVVKETHKTTDSNSDIYTNSLIAEANVMKDFDHPAFPRIVDIIEDDSSIYLVMDYIEGSTLEEVLKNDGPQDEDKVIDWALQICDALTYLHTQDPPIIYRDMKPSNVILKPDGKVKIIDFGVVRVFNPNKTNDTIALGTMGFAPPEQYSGQTDARSDIYALGMTMIYLLTGQNPCSDPFLCKSVRELNDTMSDDICKVIDKCIALNPEKRYQDCFELVKDLENVSTSRKKPTPSPAKKKIILASVLSALALIILIGGAVFFLNRGMPVTVGSKAASQASETITETIVPDVVGMTANKAEKVLTEAGFRVSIVKSYHDSVKEDVVISQSKTSVLNMDKNSQIVLTVSLGKDPDAADEENNDSESEKSSERGSSDSDSGSSSGGGSDSSNTGSNSSGSDSGSSSGGSSDGYNTGGSSAGGGSDEDSGQGDPDNSSSDGGDSNGSGDSSGGSGSSKGSGSYTDNGDSGGKYEVSRQDMPDCDGSGHGYYIVIYSDGSTSYEEY